MIGHNRGRMLITICKMLSHHFLIHSSLDIPVSAPCHYRGLVTTCEEKGIANEDNLRAVGMHLDAGGQQASS